MRDSKYSRDFRRGIRLGYGLMWGTILLNVGLAWMMAKGFGWLKAHDQPDSDGSMNDERLAKIEATIPTLATKSVLARVEVTIVRWVVGVAFAIARSSLASARCS